MILCYIYIYFFFILNLIVFFFCNSLWTQLKVYLLRITSLTLLVRVGPVPCFKLLNDPEVSINIYLTFLWYFFKYFRAVWLTSMLPVYSGPTHTNTNNNVALTARSFVEEVARGCLIAEKSIILWIFLSRFPLLLSSLCMKQDSVWKYSN